jgi:hypothetical protein
MRGRFVTRVGGALVGVGAISVVIGLLTGVTLGCTLVGCLPSAGTGFQGFGIEGMMLVYYRGCNACTISPWIVLGGLLLVAGLIAIGGSRLYPSPRTQNAR